MRGCLNIQAYCVKFRTNREIKNAKSITMRNVKPATQGVCLTCGTKLYRDSARVSSTPI
ncbi:DUF5679 domain-containing protein [Chloroflexota bacterium]